MVNVTATKAVYNLSVNPHNSYQLLSHVDNVINIWDTRCFEKPIVTIVAQKQVTKVLWCPTRRNLIGTLQKDSGIIYIVLNYNYTNNTCIDLLQKKIDL